MSVDHESHLLNSLHARDWMDKRSSNSLRYAWMSMSGGNPDTSSRRILVEDGTRVSRAINKELLTANGMTCISAYDHSRQIVSATIGWWHFKDGPFRSALLDHRVRVPGNKQNFPPQTQIYLCLTPEAAQQMGRELGIKVDEGNSLYWSVVARPTEYGETTVYHIQHANYSFRYSQREISPSQLNELGLDNPWAEVSREGGLVSTQITLGGDQYGITIEPVQGKEHLLESIMAGKPFVPVGITQNGESILLPKSQSPRR